MLKSQTVKKKTCIKPKTSGILMIVMSIFNLIFLSYFFFHNTAMSQLLCRVQNCVKTQLSL